MLDAGIIVGMEGNTALFGEIENKSPMWFIETFMTRRDSVVGYGTRANGSPASRLFACPPSWQLTTYDGEKILGSVEVGKLADLGVLNGDFMAVPTEEFSELKTLNDDSRRQGVLELEGAL